jgi:hypothetical protein
MFTVQLSFGGVSPLLDLVIHVLGSIQEDLMPEQKTIERARKDAREGKSPSTQAGEFVREEIHHIREGKHGARSAKQAIAIGLSKARRAGVKLPPRGKAKSTETAQTHPPSPKRSKATTAALKREGRQAASHQALARQAHQGATTRKATRPRAQ